MMDATGLNQFLSEGDPQAYEASKIDFDGNYFENILDGADLDHMLNQDGDFDLNDSDLDKMINPDNISLGSSNSMDHLAKMPIMELNDDAVENLLESIAKEENIPIPDAASRQRIMPHHESMLQDVQPDPLLGTLSRDSAMTSQGMSWMNPGSLARRSSFHMEDITHEVDALQRLVNSASSSDVMGRHQQQQRHRGHLDLEQEKLKLLSRLNEINQRQSSMTMSTNNRSSPPSSNMASVGGMSGISDMLRLQQRQMPAASAGAMGSGETPLTSFLRKNQKGQPGAASVTTSMLSGSEPSAPQAASVFSQTQWMSQNAYMQDGGQPNQHFFGAMDRTSFSQNMVRKLSARSPAASTDSGTHIRSGVLPRVGEMGNATWGETPASKSSFMQSGMLPKHVSDNNLARGVARGGLIKNPSKTSLSRENLRGFMRAHSRPSEDSLGGNNIVPIKRRQGAGPKFKVGLSRSVPHLMMPQSGSRGDLSQQGHPDEDDMPQMNAAW
jgi:hypothetical protein